MTKATRFVPSHFVKLNWTFNVFLRDLECCLPVVDHSSEAELCNFDLTLDSCCTNLSTCCRFKRKTFEALKSVCLNHYRHYCYCVYWCNKPHEDLQQLSPHVFKNVDRSELC